MVVFLVTWVLVLALHLTQYERKFIYLFFHNLLLALKRVDVFYKVLCILGGEVPHKYGHYYLNTYYLCLVENRKV
jgi:hypothetical protein